MKCSACCILTRLQNAVAIFSASLIILGNKSLNKGMMLFMRALPLRQRGKEWLSLNLRVFTHKRNCFSLLKSRIKNITCATFEFESKIEIMPALSL